MTISPEDIEQIKARNARVEIDKTWETSKTRRLFIASVTYVLAAIYMHMAGLGNPFLGACVPTGGYLLSTLSLPYVRRFWQSRVYKA